MDTKSFLIIMWRLLVSDLKTVGSVVGNLRLFWIWIPIFHIRQWIERKIFKKNRKQPNKRDEADDAFQPSKWPTNRFVEA